MGLADHARGMKVVWHLSFCCGLLAMKPVQSSITPMSSMIEIYARPLSARRAVRHKKWWQNGDFVIPSHGGEMGRSDLK